MWGAFSTIHDIPNANIILGRHSDQGLGGVCFGTDFGNSWKSVVEGLPKALAVSVTVNPNSFKNR